jgi:broad specificity phosphatase PhoE
MAEPIPEPRTTFKTVAVLLMFFAVLGAVVVFGALSFFTRPVTTVILVRHAEKIIDPNNNDQDLSAAGQTRAQELVRVLGDAEINAIYATQYKRTVQTAKPLADKLGLPIGQIDSKKSADLLTEIRTNHRGQTVFVVGHNSTVPEIIKALGGPQYPTIPESEYDNIFIVTVYRTGKAKVVKMKYGVVTQ